VTLCACAGPESPNSGLRFKSACEIPRVRCKQVTNVAKMRTQVILTSVLVLLPTVWCDCCRSSDDGGCPASRHANPLDQPCSFCCGGNSSAPQFSATGYSCPSCGFSSESDCQARTTCRTVWAKIATTDPSVLSCGIEAKPETPYSANSVSWQAYFNSCLQDYCTMLGCYLSRAP
jgi:hypothetical protein